MLIKKLITEESEGLVIAQTNVYVIYEIESSELEELFEIPKGYLQRCLPGRYGEELTYAEILDIRALIDQFGDADNYLALLRRKIEFQDVQLKEVQDAIIELDGGA
jgi:hypothetical protein